MKKFLKRANRGLLLGGVILIALIIYIIIDYSRFSSEKNEIKKQVESYMESFFECLESGDYGALQKVINDNWTGKVVMSDYYLTDMSEMTSHVSRLSKQLSNNEIRKKYDISNTEFRITGSSVKKAGPNMASVTLTYSVSMDSIPSSEHFLPFSYYGTLFSDDTKNTSVFEGEYTLYLYKESGTWKLAQANGYDNIASSTALTLEEVE